MTTRQDYIRSRLREWAEYRAREAYPGQCMQAGEGHSKPCSKPPIGVEEPRRIKEVSRAVSALGVFHPRQRKAIQIKYEESDDQKYQEMRWKQITRKGRGHYYETLGKAEFWIDARIRDQ